MFLLTGVARYLFVPMAEAVVFAMLTSYVLSRTLIPTLAKYWLRTAEQEKAAAANANALQRMQRRFEARFDALRERYHHLLGVVIGRSRVFIAVFLGAVLVSLLLYPFLGRNFFPEVDAGQIKLHVRAPTGIRVEQTAALVDHVESAVREVIPAARAREHRRQRRPAGVRHQPHVRQFRHHRHQRCGCADHPHEGSPPHCGLRTRVARHACRSNSRA